MCNFSLISTEMGQDYQCTFATRRVRACVRACVRVCLCVCCLFVNVFVFKLSCTSRRFIYNYVNRNSCF